MKNTINRTKLLLASLPAIAMLFVTATAYATAPMAKYSMSGSCNSHYCTEHITIGSNPSKYNVRSYVVCNNLVTNYSGWAVSGEVSVSCPRGGYHVVYAGFQYDKTHQYGVQCYQLGDSGSGSC